ncbi:N-carbamoylsarcosine amidohydrolase [Oceanobacter kriegii]|uniref:N-carbamoylsarcosine amidohydrolase n=1 Tax=Oceanobacter kriegii TaxID=64972 RepID=UPI0003FE8C55|nr:N-carbamoylsarcosine amidohydrolase [Oceanobacter kriegii]
MPKDDLAQDDLTKDDLTQDDLGNNYAGVWDGKVGFGNKAALVLIDFLQGYVTEGSPLYAPMVKTAVANTVPLLEQARANGMDVIHTRILYHPGFADGGIWLQKAPVMKAMVEGNPYAEFCPQVTPLDSEVVVVKQYASSFFGTSLAATLTARGVDTVVLVGCSTSGCVRATALDALQHGFRTIVAGDCCGDRHQAPHDANLFDINSKYGDVMPSGEIIKALFK